jgi:uncharacterized protein
MLKAAILIGAVVLLLWLVLGRGARRRAAERRRAQAPRAPGRTPAVEGMVACAHCGVHLPAGEALQRGALCYCSAAHRDAGPAPPR